MDALYSFFHVCCQQVDTERGSGPSPAPCPCFYYLFWQFFPLRVQLDNKIFKWKKKMCRECSKFWANKGSKAANALDSVPEHVRVQTNVWRPAKTKNLQGKGGERTRCAKGNLKKIGSKKSNSKEEEEKKERTRPRPRSSPSHPNTNFNKYKLKNR